MTKFLGGYVLAIAMVCGGAFEGRSALTPPRSTAQASSGGAAEVHYAPGEDLESIDVALISGAEKQIDMAAYVLTDRAVVRALRGVAARGVKVRIWRDADMAAKILATMTWRRSLAAGFRGSSFDQTRLEPNSCI